MPMSSAGLALALCVSFAAARADAQSSMPRRPFSPGERLEYAVSFGKLHVGSGNMSMVGTDTVAGHTVWHAVLEVSGGIPLYHVHDTIASWIDTSQFVSRRFMQHLHEGRRDVRREYVIDPENRRYVKNAEEPTEAAADPLDDVSMIYYVRTLPLRDGDRYELNRYFQPDANPVIVRVIGREQITVPAGTFSAIVVEPQIKTSGIFSQNGHARLWFTDDSSRVLLQMKSSMKIGSINLYLSHIGTAP